MCVFTRAQAHLSKVTSVRVETTFVCLSQPLLLPDTEHKPGTNTVKLITEQTVSPTVLRAQSHFFYGPKGNYMDDKRLDQVCTDAGVTLCMPCHFTTPHHSASIRGTLSPVPPESTRLDSSLSLQAPQVQVLTCCSESQMI